MLRVHVNVAANVHASQIALSPVSAPSSSRHTPGLAAVWVLIFQIGKYVSI